MYFPMLIFAHPYQFKGRSNLVCPKVSSQLRLCHKINTKDLCNIAFLFFSAEVSDHCKKTLIILPFLNNN